MLDLFQNAATDGVQASPASERQFIKEPENNDFWKTQTFPDCDLSPQQKTPANFQQQEETTAMADRAN